MCKFCETNDVEGRCSYFGLNTKRNIPKNAYYDGQCLIGTYLQIIDRKEEGCFMSSNLPFFDENRELLGWGSAETKINYCPFCGRPLKGDDADV